MSIFTTTPDGFFQTSRFAEQQNAINRPTQFSLKSVMIVVTLTAMTLGTVRAVLEIGGAHARSAQAAKK